jgi:hypothetical protein
MNSIPSPHGGLLYAPGLDLWTWLGYAFVLTLALFLVPGQLRESLIELGRPVMAWIARLSVRWMWEGLFIAGSILGLVRPFLCWDNWPEDEPEPDEDGIPYDVLWGTGPDP